MKSKRQSTPATLAPDTLDLLEHVLGARLPAPYRAWLAHRNGQLPKDRYVTFMANGRQSETHLHYLYAVNSSESFNDLWTYHSRYGAVYRHWYLSIGGDDFGNQFLLALKGPDHGKVFFCDHELPFDTALHLIANSFDDFIAGLRPD
ncbi:SMI1/KNR4 family protein [Paracoccus sp. R86501]|uniref:SMI1/KNR4 family protein n=1 Tax=Paracoccus sp. R86501 TaxID=3101711 RepID=UPI0036700F07